MNSNFTKCILFVVSLFMASQTFGQKFEAETATMTPDLLSGTDSPAIVEACDTCSAGSVVNTRESGFVMTVTVATAAKYNVYLRVSSPHGPKTNTVQMDGLTTSMVLDANTSFTREKVMSNINLTAGDHTFTLTKDWGWIYVDYIELEEAQVMVTSKLEAEDGTMTPAAADGAAIINCATCSGGKAVTTKESGFTVDAQVTKEANYDIFIMVASPNGEKTNTFIINPGTANALSVDFNTSEVDYVRLKVVANQALTVGAYILEIQKSWGWIDVDYIELVEVTGPRFNLTTSLTTPNPSSEAVCLYNFLLDNYGEKIISGVMTLHSFDETDALKDNTGKEPVLMGLDFMHNNRGYAWYDEHENFKTAKVWAAKNGIVTLMWHWRDPLKQTEGFYVQDGNKLPNDATDFDISKVNDPTSPEYIAMLKDIDTISLRLQEFEDNNIPVLWRPLHEAAGGWFWWGAKTGADLQTLWRLMYDRMVNYHGLSNLIWVWTNNGNDDEWYPGDAYVDMVGVDIYNVNGDHGSQILKFNSLNDEYEGKKMLALTEVEATPDADHLVNDEAAWSWYMPWYGDYASGNNPNYTDWTLWNKMFAHDYVLTQDEMSACSITGFYEGTLEESNFLVYPTLVDDQLTLTSKKGLKSVAVYNAMGVLISRSELAGNEVVLPFAEQKPGLYFVTVNETNVFKVIKK